MAEPLPDPPPPASKAAFVTGGTGFIGSHLVEALLARGYTDVRCLVRSDPKWLRGIDGIEVVRGDLADVGVLWEALDGVGYVYHLAGVTRAPDRDAFEQGNVRATLNLLGAVQHAAPEVEKVLVTSSLAAVGPCPGGVADETTPLRPISAYGRSKRRMEEALATPRQDGTVYRDVLPLVVVRPPAVYGPRERDIFTAIQAADRGVFPVVGRGREPALTLVHVRDLVRGMIDAAESPATTGETYFLGSERFYSWRDVKAAVTEALGHGAVTIPVPGFLVGAVGAVAEGVGRITGTYPPLNREKAREIRETAKMCRIDKAAADFGYRPEIDLGDGMRETVAWYRQEGWL